MKIVNSNGSKTLVMSKKEWKDIGKNNNWIVESKKKSSKKRYDPNPWAICHTTVDKEKDPEKFERCVKKVKKQQE